MVAFKHILLAVVALMGTTIAAPTDVYEGTRGLEGIVNISLRLLVLLG